MQLKSASFTKLFIALITNITFLEPITYAEEQTYNGCVQNLIRQPPFSNNSFISENDKKKLSLDQCIAAAKSLSSFKLMCTEEKIKSGHSCHEMLTHYENILAGKNNLNNELKTFSEKGTLSKVKTQKINMNMVVEIIKMFELEAGHLPNSLEEALASLDCPDDNCEKISARNKKDIWDNDYVYKMSSDKMSLDLISLGADKKEGGQGIWYLFGIWGQPVLFGIWGQPVL